MKFGLSKDTIDKIHGVFTQFQTIEKAVLYGSRAKGNYKPGSDIDLTLYGDALTHKLLGDIADMLDDLLLPYMIDLSIFEQLDHVKLKEHIERVGVVFYQQTGPIKSDEWKTKPLSEICQIRPQKKTAKERLSGNELVSFLPMEDMGIGTKFVKATKTRPLSAVDGSYTYFSNGDVLLAKITPCFENGKLGIATGLTNEIGFGSSEYIVFRPDQRLDSEWLYYFL